MIEDTLHPDDAAPPESRPLRPRRARTAPAPPRKKEETFRCSLRLRRETIDRLHIHAVKTRRAPGEVVDDLIQEHLRRFVIQDRAKTRVDVDESESGKAA